MGARARDAGNRTFGFKVRLLIVESGLLIPIPVCFPDCSGNFFIRSI
jgi:hypothetical protein